MKSPKPPFEITGSSQIVFILGRPLEHSLSPLMHNAAFRNLRMPWLYAPLEVSSGQLEAAAGVLRGWNVRGANVTVPYKREIIPFLDKVEPEAKRLGSVNTIYRRGPELWGASTDGEGFLRSLGGWRKKLKNSWGLLVGAGGAASAVAGALAGCGVKGIHIANRSRQRADLLARSLQKNFPRFETRVLSTAQAESQLGRFDWIIQATSQGLKKGDRSPLSLRNARPSAFAVDVIYHRETAFLKEAKGCGLVCRGGMGMLLHQGALSFERWTGKKAPLNVMQEALADHLSRS